MYGKWQREKTVLYIFIFFFHSFANKKWKGGKKRKLTFTEPLLYTSHLQSAFTPSSEQAAEAHCWVCWRSHRKSWSKGVNSGFSGSFYSIVDFDSKVAMRGREPRQSGPTACSPNWCYTTKVKLGPSSPLYLSQCHNRDHRLLYTIS